MYCLKERRKGGGGERNDREIEMTGFIHIETVNE